MTDDPLQTLRDARDAARRGAHAEALEKYLWFHHHALEHRRFHDFSSINRYLGRSELTTTMFAELAEHQPEFARACFRVALTALIQTRSFALARRFVTSPNEQLDTHLSQFARALNTRRRTIYDDALIGVFATRLRQLLSIFEEVGENEEANVLQRKAIEALTD